MDCCFFRSTKPFVVVSSSSAPSFPVLPTYVSRRKPRFSSLVNFSGCRRFSGVTDWRRKIIVACESASDWEFTSLNTPYTPKSSKGKILSTVLQNDIRDFHSVVNVQLKGLVDNRQQSVDRLNLSVGSDEECLHRRIAELQGNESQISVQDIIYMLIVYKFKEMEVHMVPKLSSCVCNGRLEIYPSKDWELESIHSLEVLEMVKEHLTVVIGWKENSTLTENWATKQVHTHHLCRIYAASILYGYFLKSASIRRNLELCLSVANQNMGLAAIGHGSRNLTSLGQYSPFSRGKQCETLKGYLMRFDTKTLQMHAKPKTKEAAKMIEKHSLALFGVNEHEDEEIDVISTSMSSLKRLVLEAIAFGSFLWDAEEYVNAIYKLEEN
ncbi:UV-B-induced protein At3g17800, chloroplastic-like [Impatiens glandulifera]|uniref:UV-B-induced protein At3g17800, chloroplastic-like n=1 Tax=Impatiens glandulifera TaxID=253017 RepID=UPI001FB05940|nr:UV-B-induced protein At3g17800, chloroplastic-like [Impatiens glandulifera]